MHLHRTTRLAFWGSVAVIAVLLLATAVYINHVMQQDYKNQIYYNTQQYLTRYHNNLVTNLQINMQTIRGLPGIFVVNPHPSQKQFEQAVKHLIESDPEIHNIAAAPDLVIRYMYPVKGNEAAIGLDYRKTPSQYPEVLKAKKLRKLVVAGPIKLKQGGIGLVARLPIFLDDKQGKQYFWGLLATVIDFHSFMTDSGLTDDNMPIQLAIRGTNGSGANGPVFWGDPQLFDNPKLLMNIRLPTGYWQIVGVPKGGWNQTVPHAWLYQSAIFAIALIIFVILVAFIRFLFGASQANIKFRNVIKLSPIPYMLVNDSNQITLLNKAFTDSYGYQIADLPTLADWLPKVSFVKQDNDNQAGLLAQLSDEPLEAEIQCKNDDIRYGLLSTSALHDSFSRERLMVVYDISMRRAAEEQLRFATRVFDQAHEGIIITDTRGAITDVNPAFCEITGYTREEVIGQNPSILNSGRHDPQFFSHMWHEVTEHGFWQGEVWNRKKNGELYAELLTISSLLDDDKQTQHYVGLFSDITQSKQQQETLELMAHYDVLTKLPNRVLFADRFNQAVAHSKRTHTSIAVCFVDLDNFKPVNDKYGHRVGDQLLIEVAERLRSNMREEDTVSRMGGDEFAIIFRDITSQSQCEQMLQRLHYSLAEPYFIGEHRLSISASSGIAFYPKDDQDLDTLLRYADQAMYRAKTIGRNNYQLFNPEHGEQAIETNHLIKSINEALLNNQFVLYYQPKVNMKTGTVVGMEALIRWQHPHRGLLLPHEFLPAIAETGLESKIGNWVIESALKRLADWRSRQLNYVISVNISSNHLQSPSFMRDLEEMLANYPSVPSQQLEIEILESSALGDLDTVSALIKQCRKQLGVRVALDDFGTGYSSLTHLRHLDVNTIKIDQSFVRDMLDDPHDYTIVDGVISLAKSFNRQVIAEGVETNDHGLMLLMMGCELAQGYGIARPMATHNLIGWLDNYQANPQWLEYGRTTFTHQQIAIKLFELTSAHWLAMFSKKLSPSTRSSASWPIMAPHKCHCGAWILRCKSLNLFDKDWLDRFSEYNQAVHSSAVEIRSLLQHGNQTEAKQKFVILQQRYQSMQKMLLEHPSHQV